MVLGDYIDRGPDSRGVIEMLIDLGRRCRLAPLMGNHEELLLEVRASLLPIHWSTCIGGDATLKSYGAGLDFGSIPAEHVQFMERSLDYVETATHIFLHASYDPDLLIPDQPFSTLRWQSLRDKIPGPHRSGKTVIVGHTAQRRGKSWTWDTSSASTPTATAVDGLPRSTSSPRRSGRPTRTVSCAGAERL